MQTVFPHNDILSILFFFFCFQSRGNSYIYHNKYHPKYVLFYLSLFLSTILHLTPVTTTTTTTITTSTTTATTTTLPFCNNGTHYLSSNGTCLSKDSELVTSHRSSLLTTYQLLFFFFFFHSKTLFTFFLQTLQMEQLLPMVSLNIFSSSLIQQSHPLPTTHCPSLRSTTSWKASETLPIRSPITHLLSSLAKSMALWALKQSLASLIIPSTTQ